MDWMLMLCSVPDKQDYLTPNCRNQHVTGRLPLKDAESTDPQVLTTGLIKNALPERET